MFRTRTAGPLVALALPALIPILLSVTVQSVSVSPTDVTSGSASTGTVTLNSSATSAVSVALFSSKPSLATVPAKISMGNTANQTFQITTISGQAGCATISAQVVGTVPRPGHLLFVRPTNSPGPVTLAPSALWVVAGGGPVSEMVTVKGVPPSASGAVVQLSSDNPQVKVPASVTVTATEGGPFQGSFNIIAAVSAAPTCAIITATYQGSQNRALVKIAIISG